MAPYQEAEAKREKPISLTQLGILRMVLTTVEGAGCLEPRLAGMPGLVRLALHG
ncbi:hypothetical protein EV686_10171 [Paracandidimonas soli]|uniref:Uncharacterized protein n=1 Tax=Paracandidimonas soli TaxID=1917182 RepID=A0A4R3VBG4_9BURK|nr:hypothetical protein EV686_10171 [Paracandidimonas soli]